MKLQRHKHKGWIALFTSLAFMFLMDYGGSQSGSAQSVVPGQVPAGLTPREWRRVQAHLSQGFLETDILHASDAQANDYFGWSTALDGDTLMVGALGEDGGFGDPLTDSGAVYVFERNLGGPGNWGETAIQHASDSQDWDSFGFSVELDGDTLVVGAGGEDGGLGDPFPDCGAVYVFEATEAVAFSIFLPIAIR